MNLIIASPWWLILLLVMALAAAAIEDAIRLRISNLTSATVFVGALVAMALHGFSPDLWQNAVVCASILVVGTAAFAAGWFGGGDVKLLAAIGLWLDLRAATGLVAAVFIAGGLIALLFIAGRLVIFSGETSKKRNRRIPYGLAIVAGALFIFGTQLNQRPANPAFTRLQAQQFSPR